MMNVDEKLRKLRTKMKKTLKEVSSILNVSLNTVYRWEHSLSVPRRSVLKKIADYYDVSFEWLLHGSAGDEDIKFGGGASESEISAEQKILKMLKKLPEHSKYRILGYVERICVEMENEDLFKASVELDSVR